MRCAVRLLCIVKLTILLAVSVLCAPLLTRPNETLVLTNIDPSYPSLHLTLKATPAAERFSRGALCN